MEIIIHLRIRIVIGKQLQSDETLQHGVNGSRREVCHVNHGQSHARQTGEQRVDAMIMLLIEQTTQGLIAWHSHGSRHFRHHLVRHRVIYRHVKFAINLLTRGERIMQPLDGVDHGDGCEMIGAHYVGRL